MKIICVDDEKLVLDLTVSWCRELPQQPEVYGFSGGEEVLDWLGENEVDIAILDINMPEMDGLVLAARIKELRPDTAIIFLTGYSEYAVEAFRMHASGYLMKPVSREQLADEVKHAMVQKRPDRSGHIVAHTFGEFDLLVDGKPVVFSRSKAKELLAYLIDRQGSHISRRGAFATLWEEGVYNRSMQKQLDVIIRSLRNTLKEYGIAEIFELRRGSMRIVPEHLDCDLYRFFAGDMEVVNSYRGEYMTSYPWATFTEAYVDQRATLKEKEERHG